MNYRIKWASRGLVAVLLVLFLGLSHQLSAAYVFEEYPKDEESWQATLDAGFKPGEIIDQRNWQRIKDYFPPGALGLVKDGKIYVQIATEDKRFPEYSFSAKYDAATEKYRGQPKLGPEGGMTNYNAGLPFPVDDIDFDGPPVEVVQKLMWNFAKKYMGDDFRLDWTESITVDRHDNIRRSAIDKWYGLYWVGRCDLPPVPRIEPNPTGIWRKWILGTAEPAESRGATAMFIRYEDPFKDDDMYVYIPMLRRVRRASVGLKDDCFGGGEIIYDNLDTHQGRPLEFNFKFLGKQKVLATNYQPVQPFEYKGRQRDLPYQLVDSYKIEIISKNPDYVYSKQIFWMDAKTYTALYKDIYDRKGELWKLHLSSNMGHAFLGRLHLSTQGILFANVQTGSYNVGGPGPGYVYNVGFTPSVFTISEMTKRGH